MSDCVVGVLALQGDFAAHVRALRCSGAEAIEVRRADEFNALDGLIIPGGESTAILKLIEDEQLAKPLTEFAHSGKPILGTCAGAILLAREVYNPAQASLGLIDIGIERNAYGRQIESFITEVATTIDDGPLEAVFIRAPRIKRVGSNCEVLASLNGEPVLVRENNVLAATFHPELAQGTGIHRFFIETIRRSSWSALPASS